MLSRTRRRVALIIEASRAYGRGLLSGISRFVRESQNWSVEYEEWAWGDALPPWLSGWAGDGIIVRIETESMAAALKQLNIPQVDVRGSLPRPDAPLLDTDDHQVAILAAEHLMERGFRHFAFCGFVGANYSDKRSKWFAKYVNKAGIECAVYQPPSLTGKKETIELERHHLKYEKHLAQWIQNLPKPVGIMACNDIRGQQIINVCRRSEIQVPDEVAVIGVDNDEVLCELADPPLTSVVPNTRRIGYEAARLLEQMMQGKPAPTSPVYIEPIGIVTRQSTDVLAIPDRSIATVLRYIREHANKGIKVSDLLPVAALSRSVFEHRFKQLVGRSPKEEIMRIQLARAKQLLSETDLTLAGVAEKCGFKHPEYFAAIFHLKTGMTPGKYRKENQHL